MVANSEQISLATAARDVRGLGSTWPLFRIDAHGNPVPFGSLTALSRRGSSIAVARPRDWLREEFAGGRFPGVPWFLDDLRPQGFLGRQYARRWSGRLDLPSDIQLWNDDAVLAALVLHGEDGSGDFVLGDRALARSRPSELTPIPSARRYLRYAELAKDALEGDVAGWPLAGEQPKFTTSVEDSDGAIRHVIVKFSEPVDGNPIGCKLPRGPRPIGSALLSTRR